MDNFCSLFNKDEGDERNLLYSLGVSKVSEELDLLRFKAQFRFCQFTKKGNTNCPYNCIMNNFCFCEEIISVKSAWKQ